ncbi:MAG: phosphatase PAP2 family protein [Kofleriaceae bacterium]
MHRIAALAIAILMSAAAGSAHAEPSTPADEDTRTDGDRIWHLAPMAAGGLVYLVLEFGLKDAITPDECRWCTSNGFDNRIRDAWIWKDVESADRWSNVTSYVAAPALAIGLLVATTARDHDVRRWFDDTIPVLQAGIISGMANQLVKVLTVRRRPYAEHDGVGVQPEGDENTSFFSGHSALSLAMTTASGTIATLRGYRSAPVFWIGGGVLAVVTGYLRIASDAHYATDVIAGSVVGAGIGLAVPLLLHRQHLSRGTKVLPHVSPSSGGAVFSLGGMF